jgi:hypothetical protein
MDDELIRFRRAAQRENRRRRAIRRRYSLTLQLARGGLLPYPAAIG